MRRQDPSNAREDETQKTKNRYKRRLCECKISTEKERCTVKKDCERLEIECVSSNSLPYNQKLIVDNLYPKKKTIHLKTKHGNSVGLCKRAYLMVSLFSDSVLWSYKSKFHLFGSKNVKECGEDQASIGDMKEYQLMGFKQGGSPHSFVDTIEQKQPSMDNRQAAVFVRATHGMGASGLSLGSSKWWLGKTAASSGELLR
ncbi:hypothetical protein AVEN_6821-1 [Araneus ventricosus]|uniref:Uncharacterized protein n=1 Tax=Araneus ventricosus TaxID=182803 RepID=A0A4Y2K2A6_ARAVE|nr:hypothetical protein AVEN_6821-1 [Araneus ventricosus]